MNRFESVTRPLMWFMALLLVALAAGCGGGGGGRDPILGADVAILGAPPGAILPGAVCPVAGATIPTVTATNPTDGNQFVTTSTTGVAGGGKLITATFSLAMDPATINATTFALAPVGGAALIPVSVSYNASTKVATLTTAAALLPNTSYLAIITQGATSLAGAPLGCSFAWNFKTAAAAAAAPVPVNLGLASTFGISATAGLSVPGGVSTVNGNVLLLAPTPTCGGTPAPADGIVVACPPFVPTINGLTYSPNYDPAGNLATIKADLNAAYLSITPPAGPPAAGSLGGATNLPAGTTLGAATGSALVPGDNYFVAGVYQSLTSIMITGDLTLDGQGNPDAAFIFQSSSTVDTAPGARILLINGAKASNVFWQAGTSATIDTNSVFNGNILAAVSITLNTGATSCGRMMAGAWVGGGGAITLDSSVVSVPGHVNAPAGCL